MTIDIVSINDVKTNPDNPRIIKDDKFKKLVKSIKDFPQMLEIRPIVVDDDMIVLGGNMRLKAAKEAGLKEVAIIKASQLTEAQKREFIIKDNSSFGEWDWDILKADWNLGELGEWGLDIPDFGMGVGSDDGGDDGDDDRNVDIEHLFQITINFDDEAQLQEHYERLTAQGYDCKILQI